MNQNTTIQSNRPIIIIGALFFIFGFVTWLNATLIPYLKLACELDNFQSYLVTFSFYIAYFFLAIPAGSLLKRTGFKQGMFWGLLVMAVGALIFIPAAMTRTYALFLLGLFVMGGGLAILQTASNPYVVVLGPIEGAARRVSIMGICNKIAGALAPVILGSVVLKDTESIALIVQSLPIDEKNLILNDLASRAIVPYICITAALVVLALLIKLTHLPDVDASNDEKTPEATNQYKSIWQISHLWWGVAALFLYVGAEVIAVDTLINYGNSLGLSDGLAKIIPYFPTFTMISMIVGYLLTIVLTPKYISQRDILAYAAIGALCIACAAIFMNGIFSVGCIALLGLVHAPMWPAIWGLAIHNLGKYTKLASSLLIMAIAGGALLPLLYGKLADLFIPKTGYWILIPCYLMILYYAATGYKRK